MEFLGYAQLPIDQMGVDRQHNTNTRNDNPNFLPFVYLCLMHKIVQDEDDDWPCVGDCVDDGHLQVLEGDCEQKALHSHYAVSEGQFVQVGEVGEVQRGPVDPGQDVGDQETREAPHQADVDGVDTGVLGAQK